MAQWQIFKGKTAAGAPIQIGELFDDGRLESPDDAAFDPSARDAEVNARGGDGWSYVGRSTRVSAHMAEHLGAVTEALLAEEGNGVDDEQTARALTLAAYGLNDAQ